MSLISIDVGTTHLKAAAFSPEGRLLAIAAVGVASMAEAGFFVDNAGTPVTQAISWFDPRTRPQTNRLEGLRTEIYLQTGQVLQPKWSVLKMLWLKENRPEQYDRAATWFSMMDWIIFRLTGVSVTDPSLAVHTMAYDLGRVRSVRRPPH